MEGKGLVGYPHILVCSSIGHGTVIRIIIKRMDMQSILFRFSRQLPQHIGNVLLLINRQVVLRSAEKNHSALADGDGQVAELFFGIWRFENVFQLGGGIFASDNRGDVDIVEVVN